MLEYSGLYLAGATGMHLFATYPRRILPRPSWAVVFYVPATAAIVAMVACYRSEGCVGAAAFAIQLGMISAAATSLISLGLALHQWRRARRTEDAIAAARSRAILVALTIGLLLPAVLGASHVLEGVFDWAYNSFLVVFFAAIAGYSMVRYNALDVDRFTAAVVGYGATSVVLAVAFAGVVVGVPALIGGTGWIDSPVGAAVLTGVVFLLFQPLYHRLRRTVDRFFLRQPREEAMEVQRLQELASAVRTEELAQAYQAALDTAQVLEVDRAELWVRSPDGGWFVRAVSDADLSGEIETPRLEVDSALANGLARGSAGIAGLADLTFEPPAQEELWGLGLALAAPVSTEDQLEGFLGVGRKRNGTPFTYRDRVFLDAVTSQLGIAMDRNWHRAVAIGPYRLRGRLGTGGMAEVFLAEKRGPGGFERRVAMKRILPHLNHEPDSVAMFLDEARIAAHLHHPHIVQIYDIESHENTYYLAMELMDGPSIGQWIRRAADGAAPLPLPVAVNVAQALLSALGYAHRKTDRRGHSLGLIHRDVKPANILTSRQGDVKLADFGIARANFRLYQTHGMGARGTLPYMAPELVDNRPARPQSDLFSAAAVIYEMLALRRAFPSGAPVEILPELPVALGSRRKRRLERFFERAFERHPEDRHSTAEEMREEFLDAISPITPASADEIAEHVRSFGPQGIGLDSGGPRADHLPDLPPTWVGPNFEDPKV